MLVRLASVPTSRLRSISPLPMPAYGILQYWAGSTGRRHEHTHAWQALGWRAHLEARHLRVRFTRDAEE